MNNHMLLKRGPWIVPLLATEENYLLINLGGHNILLEPHIERAWVYYLYQSKEVREVASWMREIVKDITTTEIERAISDFEKLHPMSNVDLFSFSQIPLYADSVKGMTIPIPGYFCSITSEQEKELMGMLIHDPYMLTLKPKIVSWFRAFCSRYGLHYPKCYGKEYEYLAEGFLNQHGLSFWSLDNRPPISKEEKKRIKKQENVDFFVSYLVRVIMFTFLICIGMLIADIGSNAMCDGDALGFIIGLPFTVLGIFIFTFSFDRFFKRQ